MYKPSLDLIFDRGLRNHNKSASSFPPLHFLVHLDDPITLTWLPMAEIMHVDNINVFNAAILLTSNGIAPSIAVEPATKWHQDMHLEHVEDEATTTEFVVITKLMDTKMETSQESVEKHVIGS
jgi:hypothetical protein